VRNTSRPQCGCATTGRRSWEAPLRTNLWPHQAFPISDAGTPEVDKHPARPLTAMSRWFSVFGRERRSSIPETVVNPLGGMPHQGADLLIQDNAEGRSTPMLLAMNTPDRRVFYVSSNSGEIEFRTFAG